jgi:hypothetical protein
LKEHLPPNDAIKIDIYKCLVSIGYFKKNYFGIVWYWILSGQVTDCHLESSTSKFIQILFRRRTVTIQPFKIKFGNRICPRQQTVFINQSLV